MFTAGFKFFFKLFVVLITAAIVYGYTSGGNHVGPLSVGWKGGVGDHTGYGILLALATVSLVISLALIAFRDADAEAQAELLNVDRIPIPPQRAVKASWWPTVSAFGIGTTVIGLVLHPAIFVLGLATVGLVVVEWTMDAWADRVTGDTKANRMLRNRIMAPIEIPVLGALAVGIVVLAASRILLTVSALGAVLATSVIAVIILAYASVYVAWPELARKFIPELAILACFVLLVGGVLAAIKGEREFHHPESSSDSTLYETDTDDASETHNPIDGNIDENHSGISDTSSVES